MTPYEQTDAARARSGFTLIELLVVLFILGLMAAVAVPATGSGYEHRLDMVEVQVRDAFDRASNLARSTRQTHGVVFDLTGDRFAVVDASGTAVTDPLTKRGYVVDFQRPDQPKGIDFADADFGVNRAAAIFDGQGLPVDGGTVEFRCKGATRTLSLDKATGQASVP
jgi:prepilin-type N-terminal cleavage/methylation domain-containing protein